MASKRRLRRRQCGGKRRFPSRQRALDAMFALLRRKPSPHPCHAYHCPFCRQHHFGRVRGTTTPMKTLTLTLIIATLTSCASPRQPQTHADTKQRFDPVHGWNFGDSKHRPSHAKR